MKRLRGAFPPPPKRRYDLITEAITQPLGVGGGKDRIRAGGVERSEAADEELRCEGGDSRSGESAGELREDGQVGVKLDPIQSTDAER